MAMHRDLYASFEHHRILYHQGAKGILTFMATHELSNGTQAPGMALDGFAPTLPGSSDLELKRMKKTTMLESHPSSQHVVNLQHKFQQLDSQPNQKPVRDYGNANGKHDAFKVAGVRGVVAPPAFGHDALLTPAWMAFYVDMLGRLQDLTQLHTLMLLYYKKHLPSIMHGRARLDQEHAISACQSKIVADFKVAHGLLHALEQQLHKAVLKEEAILLGNVLSWMQGRLGRLFHDYNYLLDENKLDDLASQATSAYTSPAYQPLIPKDVDVKRELELAELRRDPTMDASVFQTQLVKDRTDELTRIHKESLEINEHFKFMSSLLEVQGSKLDRIDMNIANIQDHVSLAKVQLQKKDRSTKKGQVYVLLSVATFVVVVLLLLVISLR